MIIVTLSVVCTLKVKTVDTKDQSNAIVYAMLFVAHDTSVCGSYTTLYTEMRCENSNLLCNSGLNWIYVNTVE